MNEIIKKKRGRPMGSTATNTAKRTLPPIRVTDEQLETYKAAAKDKKKSFSAWVRDCLDKASK